MKISNNRFQRLQREIQEIKVKIVQAEEDVKIARQKRDLSENTEYDAAVSMRESLQVRLNSLETILQKSSVVQPSSNIDIGTLVRVTSLDRNDVPDDETLLLIIEESGGVLSDGILSINSPLGKAIHKRSSGYYSCTTPTSEVVRYKVEVDNSDEAKKEFEEIHPLSKYDRFENLFSKVSK